jgi:hypothetical protein
MKMNPILFLIGPAAVLAVGYLQVANDPEIAATRAMSQATAQQQARQIIASDSAEATRQTANDRYTSGVCLRTAKITQGQQYESVPPGTILCDRGGWTARVDEHGNVSELAYTDDQQTITTLWW